MREQLLAYLLDDLSAEERRSVEEQLKQDPQWRQELDRLRTCLNCSGAASADTDDANTVKPPADLTTRTCCLVQNANTRQNTDSAGATHGQTVVAITPETSTCGQKRRWSVADLAVAFGVLATIGMLLLPAINRSRESSRRVACQNNMKQLGSALVHYAEQHRQGLPRVKLNEHAGIFVLKLGDSGMIDRPRLARLVVCPSSPLADKVFTKTIVIRVPTRSQFEATTGRLLVKMRRQMGGSYAYRLGYFEHGTYHYVKYVGRSDAPMLADAPCEQTDKKEHGSQRNIANHGVAIHHVANHGGCGQNVLFQDMSLRFCTNCVNVDTGDDLYRNTAGRQAAGSHPRDVVLGRSEIRPDGLTEISWP